MRQFEGIVEKRSGIGCVSSHRPAGDQHRRSTSWGAIAAIRGIMPPSEQPTNVGRRSQSLDHVKSMQRHVEHVTDIRSFLDCRRSRAAMVRERENVVLTIKEGVFRRDATGVVQQDRDRPFATLQHLDGKAGCVDSAELDHHTLLAVTIGAGSARWLRGWHQKRLSPATRARGFAALA